MVALIDWVLHEDLGAGDLTALLIPEDAMAVAHVTAKEPGVLCGQLWVHALCQRWDSSVQLNWLVEDGERFCAKARILTLTGRARSLLTLERSALNILQMLSGTATTTDAYVQAMQGQKTLLLDTRKTIPAWRDAQKYAVSCGGGHNHRSGLYDAILIKENHIEACGSIAKAYAKALDVAKQAHQTPRFVAVEVESLEELHQALDAGVQRVLLDNFSLEDLAKAVDLAGGKVFLEASGQVDLESIAWVARTGVDAVSVGALTKHIRAIDFSMRL